MDNAMNVTAAAAHPPCGEDEALTRRDKNIRSIEARIADGSINDQKIWQYIKERNSIDEDCLNAAAVIDCTGAYTYGQMFDAWERYAAVFTALGICGANRSRAAVAGVISAEPVFCFYGLNMTGAEVSMLSFSDFLPTGGWKRILRKERITDLIISDIMVSPELWREIEREREALGLRSVLLLHSRMGGPSVGPAELIFNEFNYQALKRLPGTVFLDDLFAAYADTPISYGAFDESNLAIITHTSGTTSGARKPISYSEKSVNLLASVPDEPGTMRDHRLGSHASNRQSRTTCTFDLSSFHCFCDTVNNMLSAGNTVVLTFFGALHPKFIRAFGYYGVHVAFLPGFIIDKWLGQTDLKDADFSSLEDIVLAGSYVSQASLKKYTAFFRAHGFRGSIIRIYGMSELGEHGTLTQSGEDELGMPKNRALFRIQDEADHRFYSLDDGPRTGIMCLSSCAICRNELDGEKLFDYTVIDGRNYICTNDLVRLEADGRLVYVGRADKYFVNSAGKRFDSGVVETRLTAHPYIGKCAVVPILDKRIYDTVPVLYVVPAEGGRAAAESVRQALVELYVREKALDESNLPVQFMLVDDIPCNSNGKLDIYRITRERLQGHAYNIIPVHQSGKLTDIRAEYVEQLSSMVGGTSPEGAEQSAFSIFELFGA